MGGDKSGKAGGRVLEALMDQEKVFLFYLVSNGRFFVCLFFGFFFFGCVACGIFVLQPGIKPTPPVLEVCSPNHWTTREVPMEGFFKLGNCILIFYTHVALCEKCFVRHDYIF